MAAQTQAKTYPHAETYPRQMKAKGPPRMWGWFAAYCVINAALFLGITAFAIGSLVSPEVQLRVGTNLMYLNAWSVMALSVPAMLLYGITPMLPKRDWTWRFSMMVAALGIGTLYLFPLAIAAFIALMRDDVKAYYNHTPHTPDVLAHDPELPSAAAHEAVPA